MPSTTGPKAIIGTPDNIQRHFARDMELYDRLPPAIRSALRAQPRRPNADHIFSGLVHMGQAFILAQLEAKRCERDIEPARSGSRPRRRR